MPKQLKLRIINYPFNSDVFIKHWDRWKEYKKQEHRFSYKSEIAEQAGLDRLNKLSDGNEQLAIDIIEFCISQTWHGLYPITNNSNGDQKNKPGVSGKATRESINEAFTKFHSK